MVLIPHIEGFHSIARQSSNRNEEVGITCRVGKTDACSGIRSSSRTEIPSSGELALTNKERMVRWPVPAKKSRRSNESKNFSISHSNLKDFIRA
ncbi:adenylate cyclase type 5-like protein [Corchorus olitorius]|uniref:Adenylate cyclase type 5-like protein n=1 Tax=Corchorus olitorius TaxID=93759 RepID=A0A1R3KU26_9ROSI|nr:adenylate cyclase type 5-like protein [Corchorus olitorius]